MYAKVQMGQKHPYITPMLGRFDSIDSLECKDSKKSPPYGSVLRNLLTGGKKVQFRNCVHYVCAKVQMPLNGCNSSQNHGRF